jgi:hypothetical protein
MQFISMSGIKICGQNKNRLRRNANLGDDDVTKFAYEVRDLAQTSRAWRPSMSTFNCHRCAYLSVGLAICLSATVQADVPSFLTIDPRLPNPHRPYEMTSDTVHFGPGRHFGLYDLQFQAINPGQLDTPRLNKDGQWEFESIFDITYDAQIGIGLGPVHGVTGLGTTHIRGKSRNDAEPRSFETEMLSLNLFGFTPSPQFMFRESPTSRSSGVTTVEDICPPCARPITIYRVSSFFDLAAEVSFDGGEKWSAAETAIHVVQSPHPVLLGDYNENGAVDAADYVVWQDNLGRGRLPNEIGASPGVVDKADYNYWRSRFGATAEPRLIDFVGSSVPEPSTLFLAALAVGGVLRRAVRTSNSKVRV